MKLQARNFVVRKPKTVDITVFFKKFCIATRTKSDTNFDTMGIRLVSDFFAPWGGRFCMSRHSVFSHAVRWRSARDP